MNNKWRITQKRTISLRLVRFSTSKERKKSTSIYERRAYPLERNASPLCHCKAPAPGDSPCHTVSDGTALHCTARQACCGWTSCLTALPAFSSLRFIGGWQNKQLMLYCHQLVWSADQKGKTDKNNYWWHTFLEFCFRMSMRLVSTFICLIWRFDSFAFSPAHISTVCQSMHPFLSSSHCFCHLFFSLFKNALCFSPPNQYYSFCSILLAVLPANSCAVTLTFSQQGFMVSCCCWGCLKCTRA